MTSEEYTARRAELRAAAQDGFARAKRWRERSMMIALVVGALVAGVFVIESLSWLHDKLGDPDYLDLILSIWVGWKLGHFPEWARKRLLHETAEVDAA